MQKEGRERLKAEGYMRSKCTSAIFSGGKKWKRDISHYRDIRDKRTMTRGKPRKVERMEKKENDEDKGESQNSAEFWIKNHQHGHQSSTDRDKYYRSHGCFDVCYSLLGYVVVVVAVDEEVETVLG